MHRGVQYVQDMSQMFSDLASSTRGQSEILFVHVGYTLEARRVFQRVSKQLFVFT